MQSPLNHGRHVLHDAEAAGHLGVALDHIAQIAAEAVLVQLLARRAVPQAARVRADLVGQDDARELALPDPAVLAALVASGFAGGPFTFLGFPERKGPQRRALLGAAVECLHPSVLYEAPGRVGATLAELVASGAGERRAVVARELTKQFEELRSGTVGELATYYEAVPPRGEVVIVLEGATVVAPSEDAMRERAQALRAEGLTARDVARAIVSEFGAPRNVAYRVAQEA